MSELRYNNQSGNLGSSLSNSGTTITFGAAPKFATLTGGQTITIVLEPGSVNMEIVYLTAYTATQTTGTITRQAEDSTLWPQVAHASGAAWVAAPTVTDFNALAPIDTPTFTGTVTIPTAAVTGNGTVSGDLLMPTSAFSTTTGGFTGGGIRSSIGHIISNTFTQSVGPIITTAAGASIGANITSATSLIVANAVNPPTTGQLAVATSGGTATVNYTSWTSGSKTFGGVTLVSGSGTILSTTGGVETVVGGDLFGNVFDPFIGTPLLIHYSPTINYNSGVGGFGTVGPITYTGSGIGPRGLVEVEGTAVYKVSNTWFTGIPPAFQNEMIYKNDPSFAASFCVGEGFVNVPTAIGDTLNANFVPIIGSENKPGDGQNWTCGYGDFPIFTTLNGGTLGATNPGQSVSFYSMPIFEPSTTTSQRVAYLAHDIRGGGTVATQYGMRIGHLADDGVTLTPFTAAATNIGIDCASTVVLGGATNTLTALPSNHLQIAPNTYTYNFASPTLPSAISYNGTHIFQQSAGTSAVVQVGSVLKNLSSAAANLGATTVFSASPTMQADTQTGITGSLIMFSSAAVTNVVNAGTLALSSIVNYQSTFIGGSGTTVTLLQGFFANDYIGLGVTTHVGVDIAPLAAATNNIGLRNASKTVHTPSSSQVLGAAFTVTANASTVQCTSTAARTGTTAAATIVAPASVANGQVLTIINANTNTGFTHTYTSGATELLSLGAATRVVGAGGSLTLTYNSTFGRWVEIAFNAGGN